MFAKPEPTVIHVEASTAYNVHIGEGLRHDCGRLLAELHPACKVAIITDSNVAPLYLGDVASSLESAGFESVSYVFPAGEASKNLTTLGRILEFLAEEHLTRTDLVLALGGGVTGDMAGFAAATFLRGIPYVQMPTTLLAAVDSSVGGKTAVDLTAGKNLAGAFKQPLAVFCDIETLNTLPDDVFDDGMAECIKYGVLQSPELLDICGGEDPKAQVRDIIAESVRIKAAYVLQDEFDTGLRRYLNLGHTMGHAIEQLSNYTIMHGHAVAIGMVLIAKAGEELRITEPATAEKLQIILEKNHLPTTTAFTAAQLADVALSDKKRTGKTIALIIPECLGKCMTYDTPVEKLEDIFALGL